MGLPEDRPEMSLSRSRVCLLFVVLAVAFGCSPATPVLPTPTETVYIPTPTLPQPVARVTGVPDAESAAYAFLEAWVAEDYPALYAMLTAESRSAIDEETFMQRYKDVMKEAAVDRISYRIYTGTLNPFNARMAYGVTLHSVLVGEIHGQTEMQLKIEEGGWKVQWEEGMILPELRGGNKLLMAYTTPERAAIYDRNSAPLASVADAVAIGLRTGLVEREQEDALLEIIRQATGIRPEALKPAIQAYRPNAWYLPIADMSVAALNPYLNALRRYEAVSLTNFTARYYHGGLAPHVVGYSSLIQAAEVERFQRLGYNVWSDKVGRSGLELWGEPYLGGKRGGSLRLLDPDNNLIAILADSQATPSQAIYTTIDSKLQSDVQRALGDFRGAIVVQERDTGRILAMASTPGYNPNLFEASNFNSRAETINKIFDPVTTPLLNRATEAQYPLGSVFKIVTMAAALETDLYTRNSQYECGYFFEELPGFRPHDWTYDRFLKDDKTPPSGLLDLPGGLMRSCNPWFWHIGLTLYNHGIHQGISDMARAFGFGSLTGIEISETPGNIPDPREAMDSLNLAIGQGNMSVTPLQVANMVAAIGNGGNLYQPTLVERIVPPWGEATYTFSPTLIRTLPLSPENLEAVQDGMRLVVNHQRGTANHILGGMSRSIPMHGKTGTAETGLGLPHSWFAGYSNANRADRPDIAVAVLVESIGEGSEFAAPIFRRVMELYFYGSPRTVYGWETSIGVPKTPTPEATETPVAEDTPTPTQTSDLQETPAPTQTETPVPTQAEPTETPTPGE
jgi:cell division protein FtsI/penicillin-binding protein 2